MSAKKNTPDQLPALAILINKAWSQSSAAEARCEKTAAWVVRATAKFEAAETAYNRADDAHTKACEASDAADEKHEDARLALARLLREAQRLCPKGTWEKWFAANITDRSLSDARNLIAIAESNDPEAAREAEKARARDGMAKTRAARKSAVTPDNVTAAKEPEFAYP